MMFWEASSLITKLGIVLCGLQRDCQGRACHAQSIGNDKIVARGGGYGLLKAAGSGALKGIEQLVARQQPWADTSCQSSQKQRAQRARDLQRWSQRRRLQRGGGRGDRERPPGGNRVKCAGTQSLWRFPAPRGPCAVL